MYTGTTAGTRRTNLQNKNIIKKKKKLPIKCKSRK